MVPNEDSSDEQYSAYVPFEELSFVPQIAACHKKLNYLLSFAQVSFSVTVLLKMRRSGVDSLSTLK